MLTQVTDRLGRGVEQGPGRDPIGAASCSTRCCPPPGEQPDGFRLLYQHAAREPKFAAFAEEVHQLQIALADQLVGETIPDRCFRAWATRTIVGYLVDSVLAWLEVGDPVDDADFVEQATDGLLAMYRSWAPDAVPACLPSPNLNLRRCGLWPGIRRKFGGVVVGQFSRGRSSAAMRSSSAVQPSGEGSDRGSSTNFDAPAATIFSIITRTRRQPDRDHVGGVERRVGAWRRTRPGVGHVAVGVGDQGAEVLGVDGRGRARRPSG